MPYLLALIWIYLFFRIRREEDSNINVAEYKILAGILLTTLIIYIYMLLPLKGWERVFPIDDSYITLTAARNFTEKNLLAVNPNFPLAGITSPLHALLTGLIGKVTTVETASRLLGLIGFIALICGVFIWTRLLKASISTSALAAVVVSISGQMASHALNGLETVHFTALLVWCFVAFELSQKKIGYFYPMGAMVGLSILTRPEGWFIAVALYSVSFAGNVRSPRRLLHLVFSGIVALAIVSPYLFANCALYDRLFPLTVSAKKHFFGDYCLSLSEKWKYFWKAATPVLGSFIFTVPFLIWAKTFLRRIYPLLFAFIFYLAYFWEFPGALNHYGGRYQHPLVPMLLTGVILGSVGFIEWTSRWNKKLPWISKVLTFGMVFFFLLNAGFNGVLHRVLYRNILIQTKDYLIPSVLWMRDFTEPGDLIATHDIGAAYYFAERPILDLVGLTDPEVAYIYGGMTDTCSDRTVQKKALYLYVEQMRPKLISFMKKWDHLYLGLLDEDQGKNMRQVKVMNIKGARITYQIFECTWEGDSDFSVAHAQEE